MGNQDMVFVEITMAFLMYGDSCVGKYSIDKCREIDLISVSDPRICVLNVLKYALRNLNGNGKENDLEKMAHFAKLALTLSQKEAGRDGQLPA